MPKISVIMSTAREESETFLHQWQEVAEDLRQERTSRYRPLSLIKSPFRELLLECVNPETDSFIQSTLESLKRQTFHDFEIILVDHFADERRHITDRCKDLDIRHVREKPTIWHELEEPGGFETELRMKFPSVCNARNTGIILADGDLLVFIDDNILLEPKTLETCWKWYQEECGLKILRHRYNFDTARDYITLDHEFRGDPGYRRVFSRGSQEYSYRGAWTNAVAIPLSMELEVNGFNEDFDGVCGCDDIEHAMRLNNLATRENRRMMLDSSAVAWELGHHHIQHRRRNVRANFVLLDTMIEKWGPDLGGKIRANDDRSYLPELMTRYAGLHRQRREKDSLEWPMHPYFNCNIKAPTFNLKELREKYRSGELAW